MQVFLLDVWHDLREKRLAPVAVVLLLGLLAVPVLLAKPAEDPGPAPVVAAPKKTENEALAALTKVKLGDEQVGRGSTLGVFDPDNPFHPPKGAMKKDDLSATGAGPGDQGPTGSGGTGAPGASGGLGGGVSLPGTTGGTTGGTGGGDGTTTTTTTTVYKYVVDLTFTANGHTRHVKGMEKLDMLPNESSPLLIFMGVTPKGGDAVFLVDSTLEAAGEGRCKPSESECAFAYIGAGSRYMFSDSDGNTYEIRIDEIRKVKVGASGASAKGAKGATARASVGPSRRFIPPILADVVVVAKDQLSDSSDNTESR
ncbi:MAG TPA: hypothetical protein VF072_16755 [Thermoleophilaceae bacterium]